MATLWIGIPNQTRSREVSASLLRLGAKAVTPGLWSPQGGGWSCSTLHSYPLEILAEGSQVAVVEGHTWALSGALNHPNPWADQL